MSVAVGRVYPARVVLAADRLITSPDPAGDLAWTYANKLARMPWGLVAWVGRVSAAQSLVELLGDCRALDEAITEARLQTTGVAALLTDGRRLVVVDEGCATVACRGLAAVGTGASVALGALYAGASLARSVEIASAIVPGVGGGVDVATRGHAGNPAR
jgi:hypothetical protein